MSHGQKLIKLNNQTLKVIFNHYKMINDLRTFRSDIYSNVVLPSYKSDIVDIKMERRFWERSTIISTILSALIGSLVVFFIAIDYKQYALLFSSLSLSLQGYIAISKSQGHRLTIRLNESLLAIGIKPLFKDMSNDQIQSRMNL